MLVRAELEVARLPGPWGFSGVAERFKAQRRAKRVRCSAVFGVRSGTEV
jgi:hypothetical protein